MIIIFLLAQLLVLFIFIKYFLNWISDFKIKKNRLIIFLVIPLIFITGIGLRISNNKNLVDFGYFLTDFSGLIATVLFTICLYPGQIKYWQIK
ncbi:MAG: hypothetical protein WC841_01030 [Candidatus Shapirobacteria bacterium]|jgi:hypothetical protein